ncbi:MAG TPA: hypothetical protein VNW95_06970 [Mucilaginibacter sp.]|jgi:hypothetical protein|nr:hypothetical protein [Mucilaginibacter sp.]
MRFQSVLIFFLLTVGIPALAGTSVQKFDKAGFYSVMASGDIEAINKELDIVSQVSITDKQGYEGALLLRKAGLVKKPKDKLSFFKAGRIKLETAILADNENIEFHFLRLAIEEHAPKIVKYKKDIPGDKSLVVKHFKSLPQPVQYAILNYCKNSKVLRKEDLTLPGE